MNCVTIDVNVCKGCGLCVETCPRGIIKLDEGVLTAKGYHPATVIDMERCIACAMCAIICPDSAVKVEKGEG